MTALVSVATRIGRAATRDEAEVALNGFHVTALRMIWLKVLEPNTAGIRAYTTAGFTRAGRLRQSGYWLGEVCDEILMDVLRKDFPAPSAIRGMTTGH